MPAKSKAQNTAALIAAGIPQRGFTIPQFCARWAISEGLYQKLRKTGKGPRETRLLDRIIITDDDEAAWLRERASAEAT